MTQRTASPKEIYRILSTYPQEWFPFLCFCCWDSGSHLTSCPKTCHCIHSPCLIIQGPAILICPFLSGLSIERFRSLGTFYPYKLTRSEVLCFFFKLKSKWNQVEVGFSSNWRNRLQGTSWITSYMSLLLVASAQLV